MAQIIFDIPDPQVARLIDSLAMAFNYQANITNADGSLSPNPETKGQFAKRMTIQWWKNVVRSVEVQTARKQAEVDYQQTATEIDVT